LQALKDPELEKNCVLSGGDDYELLFTAPQAHRAEIDALAAELKLPLTRIGTLAPGEARLTVVDANGRPLAHRGGFDHFGSR
jgi:thiamine-monophosphate kinase